MLHELGYKPWHHSPTIVVRLHTRITCSRDVRLHRRVRCIRRESRRERTLIECSHASVPARTAGVMQVHGHIFVALQQFHSRVVASNPEDDATELPHRAPRLIPFIQARWWLPRARPWAIKQRLQTIARSCITPAPANHHEFSAHAELQHKIWQGSTL